MEYSPGAMFCQWRARPLDPESKPLIQRDDTFLITALGWNHGGGDMAMGTSPDFLEAADWNAKKWNINSQM
jgi:hypothetical protein